MSNPQEKIAEAYRWTLVNRPSENRFPYLAEALRQAGVLKYVVNLPSGQTIYFTREGNVASQSEVLLKGMALVPSFNQESFIAVLRKTQAGEITFPEFLKGSWENGVVEYKADLNARKVYYNGASGEQYVEDFPAVELA